MDWEDLQVFRAVAYHGSLTAAADALQLTRPALSRRVARLERRLGAVLLVRTPRRCELTAAGQKLLDAAEQIDLLWTDTLDAARGSGTDREAPPAPPAELRIGLSGVSGRRLITHLGDAFPEIRWGYEQIGLTPATGRLVDGDLHAFHGFLLGGTELPRGGGLRFRLLLSLPMTVAMAADHRAAALPNLRVGDLGDERWVMDADPELRAGEVAECRRAGFEPRVAHVVADMAVVRTLVCSGEAVTWVVGALPAGDGYTIRAPVDAPRTRLVVGWNPRVLSAELADRIAAELLALHLLLVRERSPALTHWLLEHGRPEIRERLGGAAVQHPATDTGGPTAAVHTDDPTAGVHTGGPTGTADRAGGPTVADRSDGRAVDGGG
jgi:DNA-binding transcriptional LysR family regulator